MVLQFPGTPKSVQVFKTFRKNLAASLATDGINQRMIQHLLKDYEQAVFVKPTSRSMLGSMNDLMYIFDFHIDRDIADCNQIDLHNIQCALNRIPLRKIDWQFSVEAMHGILQYLKVA